MKQVLFIFLLFCSTLGAQELKFTKATMQTLNHGASPTSSTTYTIVLQKKKKAVWSIDSIVSISSGQRVEYSILKVDDPDKESPNYAKVESFKKSDKGLFRIKFGVTKNRGGSGRPGSPQNQKADTTTIEGGVTIYYSWKGKSKQLKVIDFEKLENIDAP